MGDVELKGEIETGGRSVVRGSANESKRKKAM